MHLTLLLLGRDLANQGQLSLREASVYTTPGPCGANEREGQELFVTLQDLYN